MRTIWQSLAWKEWHEHKWKLAAILAIVIACVAMVLKNTESSLFSNIQVAILLPIIPLSVLVATSTATSERSRGTLPFLASLPISRRKVATVKLLFGIGSCLLPVLFILLAIYGWSLSWDALGVDYRTSLTVAARNLREPLDFGNWYLALGSAVTLWVVSLFLWTAAIGANRADEVSAAAVALSVIASIWLGLIGIGVWLSDDQLDKWLGQGGAWLAALAFAIAPGGFSLSKELWVLGWLAPAALLLFVVVHSTLAVCFVRHFGRDGDRFIRSHQTATRDSQQIDWLGPPRQSWLTAIAWKQLRESGPVVGAGIGGIAAILGFAILAWARTVRNDVDLRDFISTALFFGCLYLGGFTTLVVGIGVFLRDLSPELHTFWRSRPISPNAWYWIKCATGLTIVFMAFQLPMLLLLPVVASAQQAQHFNGTPDLLRIGMLGVAVFITVFSIAVAVTCLMRNAVYATVLSILAMYGGTMLLVAAVYCYQLITLDERAKYLLDEPQGTWVWLAAMMFATVLANFVAWLALRNDWGRKSRY